MGAQLVGMSVESRLVAVEDASTQTGQMHLCDTFELLRYAGFGVLHAGCVILVGHLQDIGSCHGLQTRLAQVVHDHVVANGRRIHAGEPI